MDLARGGLVDHRLWTGLDRDGPPKRRIDVSAIPDAVPRVESKSKYGNPESYVVYGKRYYTMKSSKGYQARGVASWYGEKFHGRKTSNGETYNMHAMTAAHKSLPLPTYVRVTNLSNGRSVVVRVNDRGPFHADRIIDLSYTAATKLDMLISGTALVEVRAIDPSAPQSDQKSIVVSGQGDASKALRLFLQIGAFTRKINAEHLKSKVVAVADEFVRIDEGL